MPNKNELEKVALFNGQKIRRVLLNEQWWFSVVDVCGILSDSLDAGAYWRKLKQRLIEEGSEVVTKCHGLKDENIQPVTKCHGLKNTGSELVTNCHQLKDESELVTNCHQLKLTAPDGKLRATDCANIEGIFRIIQSIPSPKAEPFKLWLARVGYERMQEISDPELATQRSRELYKLKGYSDSWIEQRMRGIAIREELTDEWKNRGAKDWQDYEILTAEISKATFDLTPIQYKKVKGLAKENLRDHMNDLELIFNMLGERATTEIHQVEDSQGFNKLKSDSCAGGNIAGEARKSLEKRLKRSIINPKNFLNNPESQKKLS